MNTVTPRRAGENVPDLTLYAVAHRGMIADTRRLADLVAGLVNDQIPADRAIAIHRYVAAICDEIHQHHDREDRIVWPVVAASAGAAFDLDPLSDDHRRLDPLLDRIRESAAGYATDPAAHTHTLARHLGDLRDLLDEHIAQEEIDLFPILLRHVSQQDFAAAERQMTKELSAAHARWVLPWLERFATPAEMATILEIGGAPVRMVLARSRGRFRKQETLVFGRALDLPDVTDRQIDWRATAEVLGPIGGPARDSRRWKIFGIAAMAQFMAIADGGIVALALPSIQADLGMSLADLQWITNVYVLILGGLQLLGGRLTDFFGRRNLFLVGLLGFTAASVAVGLAQSGPWLIGARAGQALFAALMVPAAMAMMLTAFTDPAERQKAIGAWAGVAGLGGVLGTVAGGVVVDLADWRWAFFVNVPIGLLTLAGARVLRRDVPNRLGRPDLLGSVTVTGGLLALVYGLVRAPEEGWSDPLTLAAVIGGVVLLAVFVIVQRSVRHPLVPPAAMRERGLITGALGLIAASGVASVAVFMTSLHLQEVLGFSPLSAAFAVVPVAVGVIIIGGATAQLIPKIGLRAPYFVGVFILGGALLLLSLAGPGDSYGALVLPGLCLAGIGAPMMWVSSEVAGTSAATPQNVGLASGVLQAAAQLGTATGLALAFTATTTRTAERLAAGAHPMSAFSEGLSYGFVVTGALLVMALIAGLFGRSGVQPR